MGLMVDIFSNTGGIHAFASLFIAYIRFPVLSAILRKSDFDFYLFNLRTISFSKAFSYIGLLTLIHHVLVYGMEYFSFRYFGTILLNALLTTVITVLFIVMGMLLFTRRR